MEEELNTTYLLLNIFDPAWFTCIFVERRILKIIEEYCLFSSSFIDKLLYSDINFRPRCTVKLTIFYFCTIYNPALYVSSLSQIDGSFYKKLIDKCI